MKSEMCLCEELLDRNACKTSLFQVNLCESWMLVQTEIGRVEFDSELGVFFGIYFPQCNRYLSLEVYFSSNICIFIGYLKSMVLKLIFKCAILLY